MQASTAAGSGLMGGGGISYVRIEIHSATCTVSSTNTVQFGCTCLRLSSSDWVTASTREATFEVPKKPPKYDPGYARLMWARDILQETSRPKKRPSQQVQFNQVSRLRPVRPRYLSRKR